MSPGVPLRFPLEGTGRAYQSMRGLTQECENQCSSVTSTVVQMSTLDSHVLVRISGVPVSQCQESTDDGAKNTKPARPQTCGRKRPVDNTRRRLTAGAVRTDVRVTKGYFGEDISSQNGSRISIQPGAFGMTSDGAVPP